MKYLRKFNEELKPQTYKSAARKLSKIVKEKPTLARAIGAEKRAKDLEEHAKKIEKSEQIKKWKENVDTFSKYGEFNIELSAPKNGQNLDNSIPKSFPFYLDISISADMIVDCWDDEDDPDNRPITFTFAGGLVPKNEEDLPEIQKYILDDFYNGFYWGFWININYKVTNGEVTFENLLVYDYDEYMVNFQFSDRKSVVKFKNLIVNLFDSKFDYPSGYKDVTNMYDKVEQELIQGLEISSTYGIDMERIKEDVKRVALNSFYKQN